MGNRERALLCACHHGHEACARLLLARGPGANQRPGYHTAAAFIAAATRDHVGCVRLLRFQGTRAHLGVDATWCVRLQVHEVPTRFSHYARVSTRSASLRFAAANGNTTLMCVAQGGHEVCVCALFEAWARVEQAMASGTTAIMCAADMSRSRSLGVLLGAALTPRQRCASDGRAHSGQCALVGRLLLRVGHAGP